VDRHAPERDDEMRAGQQDPIGRSPPTLDQPDLARIDAHERIVEPEIERETQRRHDEQDEDDRGGGECDHGFIPLQWCGSRLTPA
jgi:hypothetical protein